jgi:hypothetical protein
MTDRSTERPVDPLAGYGPTHEPSHGPTRAREALIAEAIADCGQMLVKVQQVLKQSEQIGQEIERATATLSEQSARLEATIARYGQTLYMLDKGSRERFTATVVEQTRQAVAQALAEVRAAGEIERQRLAQESPSVSARAVDGAIGEQSGNTVQQVSGAMGVQQKQSPPAESPSGVPAAARSPLWLRYPTANTIIGVAMLAVTYFFIL